MGPPSPCARLLSSGDETRAGARVPPILYATFNCTRLNGILTIEAQCHGLFPDSAGRHAASGQHRARADFLRLCHCGIYLGTPFHSTSQGFLSTDQIASPVFHGGHAGCTALFPGPGIGLAPINKFWLFSIILLVVNLFTPQRIQQGYLVLFALGVVSSLLVIGQFLIVWQVNMETRLTGFMGHWMTLSGELMFAFVAGAGCLLFAKLKYEFLWLAGLILSAVALSLTLTPRSVWMATAAVALMLF